MMFYSQNDTNWKNIKIGLSDTTFGASGCLLTSIANRDITLHNDIGRNPVQIMNILLTAGAINRDGGVDMSKAAKALYMQYKYTTDKPSGICIAETNAYSSHGIPQHFFLLNALNSKIIDPIDIHPEWKLKPDNYGIVSYRELWYA
jgi:hypothetical protein